MKSVKILLVMAVACFFLSGLTGCKATKSGALLRNATNKTIGGFVGGAIDTVVGGAVMVVDGAQGVVQTTIDSVTDPGFEHAQTAERYRSQAKLARDQVDILTKLRKYTEASKERNKALGFERLAKKARDDAEKANLAAQYEANKKKQENYKK